MAAGTVTCYGPYAVDDTTTINTDLTAGGGGAIVKNIVSWQDQENKQVWFLICREA